MSKRLKMICAIASFAVCIAILVFGVYSAREVEYSLSGTINYEINTLFVDVNTSLYALDSDDEKSVNSVPRSMLKLENSLVSGSVLPANFVKLDYSNSDTTIENGISEEETLAYSDALNLNYGDYTGSNNQAYLFYLVMEIKNYSSEPVSATLDLDNLYNQTTNTVVQPLYTKINIPGRGDSEYSTAYLITAFGYDYPSFIQSSNFSDITLTVNTGELVPTDVSNFTFSRSGSNYTITAYNGTDTDIVIPSQYNGANVTAIGSSVFRNSNITSVYIPNTITSVGSSCFDGSQDLATVNIQPSSSNLTFSSYAFRNCSSLRSIYFPNNVTTLSSYAFYNCTGLSYVIFAEDSKITNIPSYAFYGCSGLRSTIIPYDATSIGASAFYDCSGLQSIEIPSNVTSIGSYAFHDCTNLISVTFGENSLLESIGEFAFNECSSLHTIYIPNKTMTIGTAAFQNCENIQEVHIGSVYDWLKINFDSIGSCPLYFPDNAKLYVSEELLTEVTISDFIDGDKQITEIPNCAFKNQSQLASITIPDFVTSIGDSAFSGCSSLQSIGIPSGVTSIGSFAFYGCSNIEDVHIDSVNDWLTLCGTFGISRNNYQNPLQASSDASLYVNGELLTEVAASDFVDENDNEITTLSSYAFDGQSQLASVEIPDFVTSIGDYAFSGCSSLQSIGIPSSVTSIGDYAFSGCSSLQSIGIPSSVTSIGYYAFRNCTNLVSVTFEENSVLNSIRSCAFEDCSSLESIKIPSSVTSVGNSTFSGCSSLESIEIPSSVTSIGNEAFQNCENIQEVLIDSVYHWLTLCGTFGTSSEDFFYQNPLSVRSYAKLYVNGELLTEITAADFERDSVQITNVPEYAFWGQSQLTSVTIPDFVTSIGSFAFNGCSSLESIAIPSSVTSIQSYSFQNCTNLVSVTFEENCALQSIGGYAFSGSSLQSIEIPSGVTSIGSSAFKNCTNLVLVFNLSSLDIVAGNSSHGYVAYYADMVLNSVSVAENFITQNGNYYYRVDDGTLVYLGAVPTDENTYVVIPEGTTTIRADMIPNKNLVSISIPTSVTSIGNYTFQNCTNIQEVHIDSVYHWLTLCGTFSDSTANNDYRNPLRVSSYARLYINGELLTEITASDFESGGVSITEIPNYAFCRQSQLLSVIIPSFVTSIGGSAFSGCTNLQEVHIDSVYDWLKMYVGSWFVSSNAKLYINGELLTEVKASDFVDGEDQITVVNGYAFSGQSQLVSVEIGDSVTSIGDYAFRGCSSLQSKYQVV